MVYSLDFRKQAVAFMDKDHATAELRAVDSFININKAFAVVVSFLHAILGS